MVKTAPCYIIERFSLLDFNIHAGGKSRKAYEEGYGDQAQLTHYKPLTQETDTLQLPLTSVTDNDGQQSASQSARLSTGSVDSGVGRSSSHNSYSELSHTEDTGGLAPSTAQCIPAHESGNTTTHMLLSSTDALLSEELVMKTDRDDCYPMGINQILSEFLEKVTDRVGNLELQIQMLQREVSSLKGSSVEASESTPDQSSCTSPCRDLPETEPTPDMSTVDTQSQPYTRTAAKERLYSDSKMTRDRKFEIKRMQQESARPRAFTATVDVSSEAFGTCKQNANKINQHS